MKSIDKTSLALCGVSVFIVAFAFRLLIEFEYQSAKAKRSPRWHVGDCVQSQDFEKFESPLPVNKILEVGKKKYLSRELHFEGPEKLIIEDVVTPFMLLDSSNYAKVSCPKELK